jgi:hypothetical protein
VVSITPGNVIQSRDFGIFRQAYTSLNALPALSAAQTSPGGSWVDMGGVDGGLDVRMSNTFEDVHVDQRIYPIYSIGTAGDIHMVTNLAELTPQNLQFATGQGQLSALAAGSGTRGHNTLTIDGTVVVNYFSVLYQIKNSAGDGEDIRVLLRKGLPKGSPQPKFSGTGKAVIPMDVQGYPDSANSDEVLVWQDITAALP